jgi:uncharacterized protein (PEP-CTERM system associated)
MATTTLKRLPLAAAVAAALTAGAPAGASIHLTPTFDLRGTWTDNVALEGPGQERSQFITELTPGFRLYSDSQRARLRANYQMHYFHFKNNDLNGDNRTVHELQADANFKLVDDLFYIDAAAHVGQQAVSMFGPQLNSNLYAENNRAEVRTTKVSPYLQHQFRNGAYATARYTRDRVTSDARGYGNTNGDSVYGVIDSGEAGRVVGAGVTYSRSGIESSRMPSTHTQTIEAKLRWRVMQTLALTASVGRDSNDYESMSGPTSGDLWSVGFAWDPTERTSLHLSAGKRYFGDSYGLLAQHRSRYSVWNIRYDEQVTTARAQFLLPASIDTFAMIEKMLRPSIPDAAARRSAAEAYIRATGLPPTLAESMNYLSNRYVLQKGLHASAAFNTARTVTVVSLFNTRRQALSIATSDSELLGSSLAGAHDNTRQTGISAIVNWRLGPRTTANFSTAATRLESESRNFSDLNRTVRLALNRDFSPKTRGTVEVRHVKGGLSNRRGEYRENAISATLSMSL